MIEYEAMNFAIEKHKGQKRKYTGDDYIVHPRAVAEIVRSVTHTKGMLAAAWLHDVVEDTDVTIEEIYEKFGIVVGYFVEMLTDISGPHNGNRAKRKEVDRWHLSIASASVKTIKLADLIDNSKSIVEHDSEFAKVYMEEKSLLLDVLEEGDETLHKIASKIVGEYFVEQDGDE